MFQKSTGSTRIYLKTRYIPAKVSFCEQETTEKTSKRGNTGRAKTKELCEGRPCTWLKRNKMIISNLDIKRGFEELEVELLRQRVKELDFPLENESTRWKTPKEL